MLTTLETLSDSARIWVYGADRNLVAGAEKTLLSEVDNYLTTWTAHGVPLSAARHCSEHRFLMIAVDQDRAGASGCSIDGLFRTLKSLEPSIGTRILTSGLIFFRGKDGQICSVTREEFTELGATGEVDADTEVFDLSVVSLGEWRARFASRAADSWHSALLTARAN